MSKATEMFKKLDQLILNKIGSKALPLSEISDSDVGAECMRIVKEGNKDAFAFRVLERRLQTLRKSGLIRSTRKGWVRCRQCGDPE